ncbi:hypothetical protein MUN89_19690 [Halobacillus salinarum]|uniref:DUF262 domain-containing protein n=1 Tax=Halobacillus salinarum TaxID=2932257 RepID=A0ABY4EJB8_9BACI|nr:hypothetical protein [Halobacillus salinarum]UOQ44060.1 hypothetical protein MUN89_19690 [Halobacillus salinarum]
MREDIIKGAILPPVVIGVVLPDEKFDQLSELDNKEYDKLINIINDSSLDRVSIIDGMQRTTAIIDAIEKNEEVEHNTLRVEFWLAANTNSLIYRMLILNTGQVPWNLRRQIEVVFGSMIEEIRQQVNNINLIEINQNGIRSQAGDFQANQLVELFLVFGSRKEKIDTKERLADEFTRLDFVEATSENEFIDIFYGVLEFLGLLDKLIFNYELEGIPEEDKSLYKFTKGKDLFSSQTVRVGFITAFAIEILGRPGIERTKEQHFSRWNKINENFKQLTDRLESMDNEQLGEFLDLMTLNQSILKRSSKVGDFEREFFREAFKVFIEEDFMLTSLTPCWRAY